MELPVGALYGMYERMRAASDYGQLFLPGTGVRAADKDTASGT